MGAPEVDANHYIPQGGCWWNGSDCAGTLTKQNANGAQRMPDKDNFGAVLQPTEVSGTIAARFGQSRNNHEECVLHPVPFTKSKRAQTVTDDETWVQGQVNPTLSLFDQGDTRATTVAVAHAFYSTDGTHGVNTHPEVSPAVKVGSGIGIPSPPAVAYGTDCYNATITGDVAATMGTPGSSVNASGPTVMQAMTVRRLTPRECERLQGFPDDWTLIPWRKKPAEECPDGPRYKALGNSMACNCMAWIGERIAAYEAENGKA